MRIKGVAAFAVLGGCVLLAACGGGGGVNSTPTPTPTPVNYTKVADLTGDQAFQTAGLHVTNTSAGFSLPVTDAMGSGVTVAYGASSDTYTLTPPGGGPFTTFSPHELVAAQSAPNVPNVLHWAKKYPGGGVDNFLLVVPSVGAVVLSYTLLGSWNHSDPGLPVTTYLAVGGAPTIASDMPKSGTANYTLGIVNGLAVTPNPSGPGTPHSLFGATTGTFSANFATGSIATSLNLRTTTGSDFGTFNGTGAIASGGSGFSGAFAGTSSSGFAGAFFGPQAKEMGMSFMIGTPTFSAIGQTAGVKQ